MITSLTSELAYAGAIGSLVRGHWAIENQLHWSLGVVFGEDGSQIRTGSRAWVMASLRNTVIFLLRLHGESKLASAAPHGPPSQPGDCPGSGLLNLARLQLPSSILVYQGYRF